MAGAQYLYPNVDEVIAIHVSWLPSPKRRHLSTGTNAPLSRLHAVSCAAMAWTGKVDDLAILLIEATQDEPKAILDITAWLHNHLTIVPE